MEPPAAQTGAGIPDGLQLGMGGGIAVFLPAVAPLPHDFSVLDDDASHRHVPVLCCLSGQLQGAGHIVLVVHGI